MPKPMDTSFVKIGDIIINMNNVNVIKEAAGNVIIEFQSTGDSVHSVRLDGMEAVRFLAYLTGFVHELQYKNP